MAPLLKLTAVYEPVEAKLLLRDALAEYLASLQSTETSSSAPGSNREELELAIVG